MKIIFLIISFFLTIKASDNITKLQLECDNNKLKSCYFLAIKKRFGKNKDEKQTRVLYRKVCESNHEKSGVACYSLALMYKNGEGGNVNRKEALRLFGEGCVEGSSDDCRLFYDMGGKIAKASTKKTIIDKSYLKKSLSEVEEDCYYGKRKACVALRSILKTSCNKNNGIDCMKLSGLYSEGKIAMVDKKLSNKYKKKARDIFKLDCKYGSEMACKLYKENIN